MTKAIRMMKENISLVDAAVYILDARVPAACLNPDFVTLLNGKRNRIAHFISIIADRNIRK